MKALGIHLVLDLFGCDATQINDISFLMDATKRAAEKTKGTVLGYIFHAYSPYGISIAYFLAESHIFVHSWPEYGFVATDIFTCGQNSDPNLGAQRLIKLLKPSRFKAIRHRRGLSTEPLPLLNVPNIRENRVTSYRNIFDIINENLALKKEIKKLKKLLASCTSTF